MLSIMVRCGTKPRESVRSSPRFLRSEARKETSRRVREATQVPYLGMVLQCYERIVRAERRSNWFGSNSGGLLVPSESLWLLGRPS